MKKIIMLCVALQLAGSLQAMQDPDSLGKQLVNAAFGGNFEKVQKLLDAGAPIDYQDKNGFTALMQAADRRSLDIARLLIEKGAQVNHASASGKTAFTLAAERDSFAFAYLLIDAMLKPTAEQKARTNTLVGSSQKTEGSQFLAGDTSKENKAMVLEQINKIPNQAMKQELIEYVNQKTKQR